MEIFQLGKIANCYFSLYYIKDDVDVSMIYVNYLKPGYFMKTMLDNNLVGKDAASIINARQNLSDKEFENWIKESFFQQKGFIH